MEVTKTEAAEAELELEVKSQAIDREASSLGR